MKKYFIRVAIISMLSLSFFSCKDETRNFTKTEADDSEVSCMTLTKAQIEDEWVTKYTASTNPPETKIKVLKFYAYYNPETKNYSVSVQAFNDSDKSLGNLIDLNRGRGCDTTLPALLTSKSYDIELSSLQMLNPDGTLIEFFTKLIITPASYEIGGLYFLKLDMAVVTEDGSTSRGSGLPCPPCINCNPPCPDWCEPICPPTDPVDSLKGQTNPTDRIQDSLTIR